MIMKISLDFDSVLADTMVLWVKKFNAHNGKDYKKDHVRTWTFWDQEEFKMSHSDADKIFEESWEDWENLDPTEKNLSSTTSKLSELGTIDIVSKGTSHFEQKEKWLEKHAIKYRELVPADKQKEQMDYDVFIDDDPSLAEALNKSDKGCILYHQKWNKHVEESERISRINKLNEAHEIIKNKNL